MIQVNHMASAAAREVQVNFVGQVTEQLYKEMLKMEDEIQKNRLTGVDRRKFRILNSSSILRKFIIENNIEIGCWREVLFNIKKEIEQENVEKIRIKVIEFRKKMMDKDKQEEDKNHEQWQNKKRFWVPRETLCYICRDRGHRTSDCKYTFDRLLERLKQEEISKDEKRIVSERGKTLVVKQNCDRKRLKQKILGRDEFMARFEKVFYKENEKIKFCTIEKCKIRTKRGEKIIKKGVIVPQALRNLTDEYIRNLEKRGVIKRSESEWRNPIRAIQKPNGGIRLVSNFMALNDLCEKDPYELRNIRDVIRSTQGSKYFTIIDLKDAFYSIEIEEEDKKKTAFEFDGRVYEWNSMVMGFKNAPQILQRVMCKILDKVLDNGVNVYMDDVVVYGSTREEHDKKLEFVIGKFIDNNLKINKEKMQFALGEVELLGVKINGSEQTPNEIKKNEALTYPEPRNIKELRRFLGLAGWFRSFIKNFATLTEKMTGSLKGTIKNWKWNDDLKVEFENLKKVLKNMSSIILPDYSKKFVLKTDASNVGLGAVLMQDVNGKLLPVQWASKKLTPTESRYGISEKEMLGIYWGIKKFEYELRGRRFKLITDHKALENIRTKPNFSNNRINRWIELIQEFDFEIEYQKPEELVGPDALSRIYENEKLDGRKIIGEKIRKGKMNKHVITENNKEYWVSDNGLKREMPPITKRRDIVFDAHLEVNHRGIEPTYYNLKRKFYWIGMKKTIENIIKKCDVCLRLNRKNMGGCEFVETTRQLEKVALDLIDLRSSGVYILVAIDYYTRYVLAEVINNKNSETVLEIIKNWTIDFKPEEFVTDNGREFSNQTFILFCSENGIKHNKVSVESHRSNGRVERVIRTIREGLLKSGDGNIKTNLENVILKYNNTLHKAIGRTPNEAIVNDNVDLQVNNSKFGIYSKSFRKRKGNSLN